MSSKYVCTQCLRSLRQNMRAWRLQQLPNSSQNLRSFSVQSWRLQEKVQHENLTSDPRPPMPPTTAATVTSKATATPPTSQPRTSLPQDGPSTAEMQRAIQEGMAARGGGNLTTRLAKTLRRTAKGTTESYITYGRTEVLFKSCAVQAPYTIPEDQRRNVLTDKGPPKTESGEDIGHPETSETSGPHFWFDTLQLLPTFSTWSQVTFLHMYILLVHLRSLSPVQLQTHHRYLLEHFSHAAEDKMILDHNLGSRSIRNRYLKDLFLQWRGILAAYDEGLIQGDAVLGGAVWRNIWKGDQEVDWEKVALVVAYMRRAIQRLENVDVEDLPRLIVQPDTLWSESQQGLTKLTGTESRGIEEPLT